LGVRPAENAECADNLAALGGDVSAALRRWVREAVFELRNKTLAASLDW
jgi:hypothetical protein